MCNHVQPFPLEPKLQGHCEWQSFSTQGKDDSIGFQRFDEQRHLDSLKPRNSSRQLCPK
ncbi:uncharacterized protein LACBIDRAFT_316687 [Laccaria bicolor S238N-H82]|uniref:Predicted protein n=1 Tax=Laccaria bicolor (strain S238N-H82 / ATCC MYA-4686) TaxID=486041 RepID=B0E1E9_LACBS|nr:uncharacterized protein LACBIDRAFT_316687 [Laccaria bicolor S238N-H82]EDQ99294.1 predicted protein [Laccaria bicolor S238N-H82]|eukprot:XP_001890014.1 predicted protein [Laccaria bicolor S238N-H82]